jgi:hypothetical protein
MTNAKTAPRELVEQEADADLVREMLAFAAERMMDMEIEAEDRWRLRGSASVSEQMHQVRFPRCTNRRSPR